MHVLYVLYINGMRVLYVLYIGMRVLYVLYINGIRAILFYSVWVYCLIRIIH